MTIRLKLKRIFISYLVFNISLVDKMKCFLNNDIVRQIK